ncbi:hypothetical protein JGS6364_00511 [[Clostridium] sordellii]|uniref:hypothetical protein n=1 Tax=Paraclostridium sordellii TaxID=1505 RepID=UPI0005426799|nr:hypothetical protein [Paeniclostridium sordellii]CEK29405.1 hypothetical protein JGS6364_00511 [[Clostridium] sordellii] [Paeniclostridium sordellii]
MSKGTNSIKANLKNQNLANDLRLMLSSSHKKTTKIVLVEGEDDEKFMKSNVSENVIIKRSFNGGKGVVEVIKLLETMIPTNNRFIGIKDRDYGELENSDRIFYYDNNSLELFLVESDEVLKKIYNEYYVGDINLCEIRNYILNELKGLGIIRKLNEVHKWMINIRCVSIDKAYNTNLNKVDIELIIGIINENNKNFFKQREECLDIVHKELEEHIEEEELLLLIQGHDFIRLFQSICNNERKRNKLPTNITEREIGSAMRCSYSFTDFQKTDLYKLVNEYEKKYDLKILV